MTKKIFNPLFDTIEKSERQTVIASEPVVASKSGEARSPISGKPMQTVLCDGIKAFFDADNRLCLPMVKADD